MHSFNRKTIRTGLALLRRKTGLGAAALAFSLAVLAPPAGPALAGDLDAGQEQDTGSRFVRIGLNKSIVIRLPAEARDVLVGNPEIVDAVVRTKNTAYLFARAVGQTNIFFFDGAGQQILALDLEVAQDMAALQKLIQRTIPGTRITVDTINDNVVLGGVAATPGEAKMALDLAVKFAGDEKKVMSTINVTGKEQVMLRVRVTEIQRDVLKQFGIDTQALFSSASFAGNIANIIPLTANPTGLLAPSTGQSFTYQSGGTQIDAVVRMMERDGILRTLAEPTLTAISGESAKFLAGGQFPVPSSGNDSVEDGVTTRTVGVEFKDFGVGLGFTPVVISEGRISLKINTEVSELTTENALTLGTSSAPILIPALKVRRAETTVELPSGGSMVLAGLIKDSTKQQINGIPGLKNLPILGALFRSRDFLTNQTELAIIVTPFIVDAVNERQLASPLDGLNEATDRQTILLGRLNKIYGAGGQKPKGVYHGNVGFIVE
jgi:pilus assembly protein CpaC